MRWNVKSQLLGEWGKEKEEKGKEKEEIQRWKRCVTHTKYWYPDISWSNMIFLESVNFWTDLVVLSTAAIDKLHTNQII